MIASIGPNLPQDLFHATESYAGPLRFDPDRSTLRAGEWLESKFAPWAFPLLESWAEGAYDDLDCVVFSRADDTCQRLYYYICELQRRELIGGPEAIIFDVAKVDRASSVERMTDEVGKLAGRLKIGADRLEQAIAETNRKRAESVVERGSRPCLLAGTAPPDRRLHDAIARAGFDPVGETIMEFWRRLGEPVEEDSGDPFKALARQLHAAPFGPRSLSDPAQRLSDAITSSAAQAIILWRIEEDEAEAWHLPAQKEVLDSSGIPNLVMVRRDWKGEDGAGEEITAFLSGIGS